MTSIPFNRPYKTGKELQYIEESHLNNKLSGDGLFTERCHSWLKEQAHCSKALLTHSCTAALEMAALLLDIKPGDEIIMPSYTFVSTANAFVLQGGKPVFIDIREDTLNIDERLIEEAISDKTVAIVPVHYAGIACEMETIQDIARRYNLKIIEDAAQGVMACYQNKPLGSIGDLGAYSFHDTKNIISGEGGALLVNNSDLAHRAEIIREKGTNRSVFLRGEVDKYTWQDVGSSFLPSDMIAAFLFAQLENAQYITDQRLSIWNYYNQLLEPIEKSKVLRRPIVPINCNHNAHMYYVLLAPEFDRNLILNKLKEKGIFATSHYVPLHSSKAGKRFGKIYGNMTLTDSLSERIIRLPLWVGLTPANQEMIVNTLNDILRN
ncbi:MAG: dTDP-4-amino-4,6-dideoxygalactose transaminase [Tatlockia sp.]|nr:dTDP-4-amino-4,6-dideoxygalactose transaminase [Tatlockia sp.]